MKIKIVKIKDLEYKVNYGIILYDVEPFTNIGNKIINFLDDIIKHDLISKYTWKIIDDTIVKYKTLKKVYKYLKNTWKKYQD